MRVRSTGYTLSGTYIDTFPTINTCDSIRTLNLVVDPYESYTVEKEICEGDTFGGYSQTGIYVDTLPEEFQVCGIIQILKLKVISCTPIIVYDLDECRSVMSDGSHMDYSEFTPEFPSTLPCAEITADILFRIPDPENKHSCTPGVNGSAAMCVNAIKSCQYVAGHSASVIFEFTVTPHPDSIARFREFEFFEKAPINYSWINGPSGLNNTPDLFGIRILKNGIEIFQRKDIPTNLNWGLKNFNFRGKDEFIISEVTTFRIELLAYCPLGNSSDVSVWDIDEVKIYGDCIAPIKQPAVIDGFIRTKDGNGIANAYVYIADNSSFQKQQTTTTNEDGFYTFDSLEFGKIYFIKVFKNDDFLNGVSAIDLIYMQKHLLGINIFESLDQYIAGDINRSDHVSTVDLLEIQKLLLGIHAEFPRNTSWRFGALPQDFTGSNLSTFQEIKTIELLNDLHEVNFLGIKIGDLNGDVD